MSCMSDILINSLKSGPNEDQVVAVVSVAIFNRKEYEGLNVGRISPMKLIDDWGITLEQSQPMMMVGDRKDIEYKVETFLRSEWEKHDIEKKGK